MFDFSSDPDFLPLQQSAAYAEAAVACGARVAWHDLGCGQALAIERGRMRLISRGPIWSEAVSAPEKRRALRRLARWPGLTIVTAEEEIGGFGLIPLVTPMHHAIWGLGANLRAGMAGKWRNRLLASERSGVRVTTGNRKTLEVLIEAERRQRKARRYRALPEDFARGLPPSALRLWQWQANGAMQAAMAFVVHGNSASYLLGWGSDLARSAGVHAVMMEQAAQSLWAEGIRWLDLGAVDSESAPGLARFKLGTGAALHRLGATMLVLP
ncbi:MAG: GNAT family N-acetyltransferase [Tabrizicola sp.]|nr:GNAT family N-acetyltransferase [Tabrizicola sp.]